MYLFSLICCYSYLLCSLLDFSTVSITQSYSTPTDCHHYMREMREGIFQVMVWIFSSVLLLFAVSRLNDHGHLPPPAGGVACPHGDHQLVRLAQVCLDQGDLLGVPGQGGLHVALVQGGHVVHLQLHQLVSNLGTT